MRKEDEDRLLIESLLHKYHHTSDPLESIKLKEQISQRALLYHQNYGKYFVHSFARGDWGEE